MAAGRRWLLLAATVAGVAGCAGPGHRDGRPPAPPREAGTSGAPDLGAAAAARLLRGDPGAAAPLYERAVGREEEEVRRERARLAVDLSSLALAYDLLGRKDEAERAYARALPMLEETLGPDHPEVARCLANLSALYWRRGAAAEARPLAERALAIAEASLGPDDPKTALARRNLALMTAEVAPGPPDARDRGGAAPVATATVAGATSGAVGSAVVHAAAAGEPRGGGRFAVQLAAVREPSGVAAEWQHLAARHPGLAGLEPQPPRAVGAADGGVLYRVLGGSFATAGEARAVCEGVRAEGDGCRVVAL